MNKAVKVALIVAGSCLGVGLLLSAIAAALIMNGTAILTDRSDESLTHTEYTYAVNKVDSLDVQLANLPVSVSRTDSKQISVSCWDTEYRFVEVELENGRLTLVSKDTRSWWEHIGTYEAFTDKTVEIALPESYTGVIDIETSNGRIDVEGITLEAPVTLSSENASITAMDLHTTSTLTCSSFNGRLTLDGVSANGAIVATTSNAAIDVMNASSDGDITVTTDNGHVSLDAVTGGNVCVTSSNAAIVTSDLTASGSVTLSTDNGRLEFDRLSFRTSCTLESSNGSIVGSIVGRQSDFTIRAESNNGRCNLPEWQQGGSRTLDVESSNGRVEVTFDN